MMSSCDTSGKGYHIRSAARCQDANCDDSLASATTKLHPPTVVRGWVRAIRPNRRRRCREPKRVAAFRLCTGASNQVHMLLNVVGSAVALRPASTHLAHAATKKLPYQSESRQACKTDWHSWIERQPATHACMNSICRRALSASRLLPGNTALAVR